MRSSIKTTSVTAAGRGKEDQKGKRTPPGSEKAPGRGQRGREIASAGPEERDGERGPRGISAHRPAPGFRRRAQGGEGRGAAGARRHARAPRRAGQRVGRGAGGRGRGAGGAGAGPGPGGGAGAGGGAGGRAPGLRKPLGAPVPRAAEHVLGAAGRGPRGGGGERLPGAFPADGDGKRGVGRGGGGFGGPRLGSRGILEPGGGAWGDVFAISPAGCVTYQPTSPREADKILGAFVSELKIGKHPLYQVTGRLREDSCGVPQPLCLAQNCFCSLAAGAVASCGMEKVCNCV